MNLLYLVSNANQFRDAQLLARAGLPVRVVTLHSGLPLDMSAEYTHDHVSRPTAKIACQLWAKLVSARSHVGLVLLGQDVGPLERFAAASARRLGLTVGLMPDGLAFDDPTEDETRSATLLGRTAVRLGLSHPPSGQLGNTKPDLVVSWGQGWEGHWRSLGIPRVLSVGSPRSQDLLTIPGPPGRGNVLVASQPLAALGLPRPEVESWYQFMHTAASEFGWRLRPHPWERQSAYAQAAPALPQWEQRPFLEDLEWADSVISPCSTLLLEAAATGRVAIAFSPGPCVDALRRRSPALRDPSLINVTTLDGAIEVAYAAHSQVSSRAWADSYLLDPVGAARRASEALAPFLGG